MSAIRNAILVLLLGIGITSACDTNAPPAPDSCEEALLHTVALTVSAGIADSEAHRAQVADAARPAFDRRCRALPERRKDDFTACVLASTSPDQAHKCR